MQTTMQRIRKQSTRWVGGGGERGGLTVFSAVLILILMTLMVLYATRVSVFESRVSGNEVRQKEAFHAAEAALEQGIKYFLKNAALILSARSDVFPDGLGGFTRDGWFASGQWGTCTATETAQANHPCGGNVPAKLGSYFYDDPNTATGVDSLPVNMTGFPPDVTARLSAIMCFIDLSNPTFTTDPCKANPTGNAAENEASLVITMLAYGYADCTDATDVNTCTAEATIAKPISAYDNLSGTPLVPLTTKSTFPPGGTAEVVPNPNAGGVGVPVSVWSNSNLACSNPPAVVGAGSWGTCELQEWYGVDEVPVGTACDQPTCKCDWAEKISYTKDEITVIGIDIIEDPGFPCDLFEFYFGYPREYYERVKADATVLSDCQSLGPSSSGLFWISGSNCTVNANTTIGSPDNPVILISAATLTKLNGGAEIFGVLYIFDGEPEHPDAKLDSKGSNTIYGAVIVDAVMGQYKGTFQIVYADGVLANASAIAGLGAVNGGWRDFGLPDLAW